MPFKVGDKVVYPHHGAAVIEGTDTITMPDGAKNKYFVLRMTHGDLLLKVPTDRAEEIGIKIGPDSPFYMLPGNALFVLLDQAIAEGVRQTIHEHAITPSLN